jgi:phasin family protein
MELNMADARQENKFTQKPEEALRQAGAQVADQTRQIGVAASKAGEDLSQVSADLLKQNTELLQNSLRLGLEAAAAMMGRSTDQIGRTFGLSGDEAQKATERSVRNTQTVLSSATAVSKGMNDVSREYFTWVRAQIETNMDRMNDLWRCRTPHDFVALQSDLVKETLTRTLETSRRLADKSLKVAEDAGRRLTESGDRAA